MRASGKPTMQMRLFLLIALFSRPSGFTSAGSSPLIVTRGERGASSPQAVNYLSEWPAIIRPDRFSRSRRHILLCPYGLYLDWRGFSFCGLYCQHSSCSYSSVSSFRRNCHSSGNSGIGNSCRFSLNIRNLPRVPIARDI